MLRAAFLCALVLTPNYAIAAQAPAVARDADFVVYFERSSATLTPQADALVRDISLLIKRRRPDYVRVIGHADTLGPRLYNLALSRRRSKNVAARLLRYQVSVPIYASWRGQRAPPVPTEDETPMPENRAVQVIFVDESQ